MKMLFKLTAAALLCLSSHAAGTLLTNAQNQANPTLGRHAPLVRRYPPALEQRSDRVAITAFAADAISKEALAWADKAIKSADVTNHSIWPALHTQSMVPFGQALSQWSLQLHRPRVYVISMEKFVARRVSFAQQWEQLGFAVEHVQWLPGINASHIPSKVRNPKGAAAEGGEKALNSNLGVLGCLLSHMAAYRHSVSVCPECDVMVFEDDVSFHPQFKSLWSEFVTGIPDKVLVNDEDVGVKTLRERANTNDQTKKSEKKSLPTAVLHFGGDAFWSRKFRKEPTYYVGGWVSRAWGYAIKAKTLQKVMHTIEVADLPVGFMGVDQLLSGFPAHDRFAVLSSKIPLVKGIGKASVTEHTNLDDLGVSRSWRDTALWNHPCWWASFVEPIHCIEAAEDCLANKTCKLTPGQDR